MLLETVVSVGGWAERQRLLISRPKGGKYWMVCW